MRKITKRIGVLLLPVFVLQIPLPAQNKSEVFEKVFRMDASRPVTLEFHDVDGSLILTPSADNTVSVRIKKEIKVRDAKRAERLLRDTKVDISERENSLTIRIKYPRFRGIFFWIGDFRRVKVTSEISVPASARLKIALVDGSIRGDNLQADMDLSVVDGDIRIDGLKGTVRADAVDGDMRISGDLKGMNLKSVDGDIHVGLSPASAMAKDWEVRTIDGDVDIAVPAGFSADVSIQTGDGRIETEIPLAITKQITRKKFSGKLGSGGFLFSIRTTDGHISLRKS